MSKYYAAVASVMLCIFMACGPSLQVTTDYDRSASFQQYKTFRLYAAGNINGAVSSLNQDRIRNAIRNEMVKKGYSEKNDTADLLVNPVAIFKERVAVSSSTDYYGYGGAYRPYTWGTGFTGSTTYNVQQYKDGSLIIDIIAADTRKLIWQGIGNSEIDKPLKDPDTEIPKAISTIMGKFPPAVSK